ncbi:MAG: outer membrane beta-barrel protein [Desulfobacterales bacterium]|nr:MAG: outer membrane beta-barrel protein [Desulfobacterales bacterium]
MKARLFACCLFLTLFFLTPLAFSYQFNFTPRASVSEEYTDNVFLSDNNKKDDFITIVSAGFAAQLLGKSSGLELSYDPARTIYIEFDERNTWRHAAQLVGWKEIEKHTRLEFADYFLRSEDPLSEEDIFINETDLLVGADPTIRRDRRTFYTNTARARISHQFGADDQIYAEYLYSILRNNASDIQDNDRHSPSIGLNYWFTNLFGLESRFAYTRGEYDEGSDLTGDDITDFNDWSGTLRLIRKISRTFSVFGQHDQIYRDFDDDGDNDYMVYAPSVGLQYAIEKNLVFRLGGGYFYQSIDDDDDEDGFFVNAEIDKTWDYRRGSINLRGSSGLDRQDFGAENLGFERFAGIQASADYSFTRTLVGDINGYYRYADVIEQNSDRKDHRFRAGAGLSYLPTRWMTLTLSYEYNRFDSNENEDYEENRVLLRVTLQPHLPWRF